MTGTIQHHGEQLKMGNWVPSLLVYTKHETFYGSVTVLLPSKFHLAKLPQDLRHCFKNVYCSKPL